MPATGHSVQPFPVNCGVTYGLSKSLCWGNSLLSWLIASNLSWEGTRFCPMFFCIFWDGHVAFGLLCSINMVYWFPLNSSLDGVTVPESYHSLCCLSGFALKVTLALESVLSSFTFLGEFMKICIFILKCLVEFAYKSFVLSLPLWLFLKSLIHSLATGLCYTDYHFLSQLW